MANFKDQEEAHKEQYEQKIKELEMEIKNLKSAEREPVVMSCNHEEEIMQIHVGSKGSYVLFHTIFNSFFCCIAFYRWNLNLPKKTRSDWKMN